MSREVTDDELAEMIGEYMVEKISIPTIANRHSTLARPLSWRTILRRFHEAGVKLRGPKPRGDRKAQHYGPRIVEQPKRQAVLPIASSDFIRPPTKAQLMAGR